MKLNDDIVLVAEIKEKLNQNQELFGKRYCPCVPFIFYSCKYNEDFICPCKDFRENTKEGEKCHCGLYIK